MTERKSKKMVKHIKVVKGITVLMIIATIISIPLIKSLMSHVIDDVIDVEYKSLKSFVANIESTKDDRVAISSV